ncbi:hypothetical protein [Humibacter sp. RRB41]|uniref:hypothetical protein n=1 Tax=Humibacter sp. RRB41 TaxID=2919946 RepID=UPI001FAB1DA1|nr:hypothetical protein [Humibacter sp. RRB41]
MVSQGRVRAVHGHHHAVRAGSGGIDQLLELIEEHGSSLRADLQEFYGINIDDVWNGRITVRHVLELVPQLGSIPHSRMRAEEIGFDFFGWGRTEVVLANLFDRLTYLLSGEDLTDESRYPRPSEDEPEQAATVAEFDVDRFQRLLGT